MHINRVNIFNNNMRKKCWCEFSSVIKESIELSSMFLSPGANIKDSHESHTTLIMAILIIFVCIVLKAYTCKYVKGNNYIKY